MVITGAGAEIRGLYGYRLSKRVKASSAFVVNILSLKLEYEEVTIKYLNIWRQIPTELSERVQSDSFWWIEKVRRG